MDKLFSDLKTDIEKANFFLSGRGYETGVIAQAIQNDVAMAYSRCDAAAAELRRLEAEVKRKSAGIKFLWQECDNQERIKAQLLEALESLAAADFGAGEWTESAEQAALKARAAIEAAHGITGDKK